MPFTGPRSGCSAPNLRHQPATYAISWPKPDTAKPKLRRDRTSTMSCLEAHQQTIEAANKTTAHLARATCGPHRPCGGGGMSCARQKPEYERPHSRYRHHGFYGVQNIGIRKRLGHEAIGTNTFSHFPILVLPSGRE